jgi:NAD(P)-dependent dehydrogenase (short-subunit alcohol dehydrogenase family)
VTGASRGLGRAVALGLAAAGAEVLVMARSADSLEELAGIIRAGGGTAHVVPGSVDDAVDTTTAAALAERVWGRLDILVNNAGISPAFRRSEHVEPQEWRRVLDVNLSGAFECCRLAMPLMQAVGGGSIVNVSSVHGHVGHARLAAYASSKGGLELLTRTLAVEWAPQGIRVNAIAPGYLETDMTAGLREHEGRRDDLLRRIPMGRFGSVEEIVPAVVFLAGPGSSYMTGATLLADGGWTAQ